MPSQGSPQAVHRDVPRPASAVRIRTIQLEGGNSLLVNSPEFTIKLLILFVLYLNSAIIIINFIEGLERLRTETVAYQIMCSFRSLKNWLFGLFWLSPEQLLYLIRLYQQRQKQAETKAFQFETITLPLKFLCSFCMLSL